MGREIQIATLQQQQSTMGLLSHIPSTVLAGEDTFLFTYRQTTLYPWLRSKCKVDSSSQHIPSLHS